MGDSAASTLLRGAWLLALAALSGCGAATSLEVDVFFDSTVTVEQLRFEVTAGGQPLIAPTLRPEHAGGPLPSGASVAILLRDAAAGRSTTVKVTGLHAATDVISGETDNVLPTSGGGLVVPVLLQRPIGMHLASVAVTPSGITLPAGAGRSLVATATYSDGTSVDVTQSAEWTSSSPSVAAVTLGQVTALSPGRSTVSATLQGSSGMAEVVVTPVQLGSIAVTPPSAMLPVGATLTLKATGTYSDGSIADLSTSVTWTSGDPNIAGVMGGVVTALQPGPVVITASRPGVMGTATVTVTSATLSTISITPTNPMMARGSSLALFATGVYTDKSIEDLTSSVTWTSSDPSIVSVSNTQGQKGVVSALGIGSVTITATRGSTSGTTTVSASGATLRSIAVTPPAPTIALGTTLQVQATGTYSDGTTQNLTGFVTWTSSNPAAASVSSRGLVTASGQGTTSIAGALGGVSGATTLVVSAATLTSVTVTPSSPSLVRGTSLQLTATAIYSDASRQDITASVTWASSSPSVASVSNASGSAGLVSAVGTGSATISATTGGVSGTTVVTVTTATLKSISVTPVAPTLAKGTSLHLVATGSYSDGSTQDLTATVAWSSSSPSVATVSNSGGSQGLASGISAGTTTVSAALGGTLGSTTLTVTSATLKSLAVTPMSSSIVKGTLLALTATGSYSDGSTQDLTTQVSWSSSSTAVATISNASGSQGVASGAGPGAATITAAINSTVGSTSLTVTAATLQSIAITPSNATIVRSTSLQLKATASFSDGTTQDVTTQVTWSSSDASVASVSNASGTQGLATGVGAGVTTLGAALGAINGTSTLTVSVATLSSISVTPGTSTIAHGKNVQYTATGTYSNGTTQDLTTIVTWSSSIPQVATISNANTSRGLATGASAGSTTISATLSGVTGHATLNVT